MTAHITSTLKTPEDRFDFDVTGHEIGVLLDAADILFNYENPEIYRLGTDIHMALRGKLRLPAVYWTVFAILQVMETYHPVADPQWDKLKAACNILSAASQEAELNMGVE